MTKEQRKRIEREFYRYEQNRSEAANFISDQALAKMGVDFSKERVKASQRNFVEENVVKALDDYMCMYKWCLVYEKTLERFKWTQKDRMMQMRYIDRNHEVYICDQIGISRSNYYYWVLRTFSK